MSHKGKVVNTIEQNLQPLSACHLSSRQGSNTCTLKLGPSYAISFCTNNYSKARKIKLYNPTPAPLNPKSTT